jgi:P27 family predicted phage terminase small subunit
MLHFLSTFLKDRCYSRRMKTGRKPKSETQRALEGGEPIRRPVRGGSLTCALPAIKPSFIEDDPIASGEWDRLIAATPDGHFTELDVANLVIYCQAWSLRLQALDDISANGLTGARGAKNPSLTILKQADGIMLQAGDRLGLALADRDRVPTPSKPQWSKFGDLLGKRKG